MSVDNVARASRPTKASPRGVTALPDSDLQSDSETAGAALWEKLRGGPPQSDDAVRHWPSCTRFGEVLGGLRGLEARVTLGGLGRWEGAAHDTLRVRQRGEPPGARLSGAASACDDVHGHPDVAPGAMRALDSSGGDVR